MSDDRHDRLEQLREARRDRIDELVEAFCDCVNSGVMLVEDADKIKGLLKELFEC